MIDWKTTVAAIWQPRKNCLRAVTHLDPIALKSLIGIDRQANLVVNNTERFLARLPANNVLLWGSRGTGKSSLIKAILNQYKNEGLRLIQVDKDELVELPEIVNDIRDEPYRFVVFCDDLSFEAGESAYKALKSALDGSIELPPDNVLIYATSNRRHLLPEKLADNLDTEVGNDGEIHFSDAVEEKISLSDRFGLWVSFHATNQQGYLDIVDSYFPHYRGDRNQLHDAAKLFAMGRGSKSGRTARQFFNYYTKT